MHKPNPKKVPAQFLQALKNTPQIPVKSRTESKENMIPSKSANMPRQLLLPSKTQQQIPKQKQLLALQSKSSRTRQDDFSKISQSYVLQGNKLKKYQTYNVTVVNNAKKGNNASNIPSSQFKQSQQIKYKSNDTPVSFQQKVKLEYLQKEGFLKPEQKARLQLAKKQKNFPLQPLKHDKIQKVPQKRQKKYTQPQNMRHYALYPNYNEFHEQEENLVEQQYNHQQPFYPYPHSHDPYYSQFSGYHEAYKSPQKQLYNNYHGYKTALKNPHSQEQQIYQSARGKQNNESKKQIQVVIKPPNALKEQCYQNQAYYQGEDQQQEYENYEKYLPINHNVDPRMFGYPGKMPMQAIPMNHEVRKVNEKGSKGIPYYNIPFCYPHSNNGYNESNILKQKKVQKRSQPKKQIIYPYNEKAIYYNNAKIKEYSQGRNQSAYYGNPTQNYYNRPYY